LLPWLTRLEKFDKIGDDPCFVKDMKELKLEPNAEKPV
jgi:hypothetical protein